MTFLDLHIHQKQNFGGIKMISEIRNGRAYTRGDNEYFTDLPDEEQKIVRTWIQEELRPRKTPLLGRSSYGLKHVLQGQTDIYLTNNQFKDAMLFCGYQPVDSSRLNWNYCLSKRSPAFHRWKDRRN